MRLLSYLLVVTLLSVGFVSCDNETSGTFWIFNSGGKGYWYESDDMDRKKSINWSINGNTLTVDEDVFTIKQLTSDKLVVLHTWNEEGDKGECTDTFRKVK